MLGLKFVQVYLFCRHILPVSPWDVLVLRVGAPHGASLTFQETMLPVAPMALFVLCVRAPNGNVMLIQKEQEFISELQSLFNYSRFYGLI